MTTDMNMSQSASSDVLRRPLKTTLDHEFYLWFIIGCSVLGAFLIIAIVAAILYFRRHLMRKAAKDILNGGGYKPGAEFCQANMLSSFSSSASSEGVGDSSQEVGRHFRRPLGPSASLDPPALLRMMSEERVQPRPALTRWHTVAAPNTKAVALERDSDEEEPPCVHGRLWFSVLYSAEARILEVSLIKAKHLPGRGLVNAPRDPFVKVFLLPDEENFHQSKIRKRTLSPKFNETFEFKVSPESLSSKTLKLSVYDVDKRKVRHCLGHVLFPLPKMEDLMGDVLWRDLEMATQSSASLGEIQISLSCNPYSNRIKATVCKLRNLPQDTLPDNAVVYVKVQLFHGRKLMKSRRTIPASLSPELSLDESFSFGVSGRFFDSCSLAFTVTASAGQPKVLGRTTLGPFMYARGEQLRHWQEMLSNPRSAVTRWHPLDPPPPPGKE